MTVLFVSFDIRQKYYIIPFYANMYEKIIAKNFAMIFYAHISSITGDINNYYQKKGQRARLYTPNSTLYQPMRWGLSVLEPCGSFTFSGVLTYTHLKMETGRVRLDMPP